jgi:exopolysaccharide biosynthesis protein
MCAGLAAVSRADWRVEKSKAQSEPGGDAIEVTVRDEGARSAQLILASFSPAAFRLQVIENVGDSSAAEIAARYDAAAAINGGYFQADRTPVGLLVSHGLVRHPLSHASLLSGLVLVREGGQVQILRSSGLTNIRTLRQAIQSGPFLVEHGKSIVGLNQEKVAARSFAFTTNDGQFGLGICRSVTLAELSQILTSPGLGRRWRLEKALNLDGGSSTDLFLRLGQADFSSPGWVSVQNYLVVTKAR